MALVGSTPICDGCARFAKEDPRAPIIVSGPMKKEEPVSNPNPPSVYKTGICKCCGKEKRIFTKSEICQSCNRLPKSAAPEKTETQPSQHGETLAILVLNISRVPGLEEALAKCAADNLRTPEHQALWFVRQGVMG
jgi:hypothetical protein